MIRNGSGLSARRVGADPRIINRCHAPVPITEVPVSGLRWIGGPRGSALVGKIVIVHLLGDNHDLFFPGRAYQQSFVGKRVVTRGLGVVGSCSLNRKFLGLRPYARRRSLEVVVDRRLVTEVCICSVIAACDPQRGNTRHNQATSAQSSHQSVLSRTDAQLNSQQPAEKGTVASQSNPKIFRGNTVA